MGEKSHFLPKIQGGKDVSPPFFRNALHKLPRTFCNILQKLPTTFCKYTGNLLNLPLYLTGNLKAEAGY